MKYLLVNYLALILSSYAAVAQETLLVTKDRPDRYEEYSVLKEDKKTKHGLHLLIRKSSLVSSLCTETVANYSYGKKDGYWEQYYNNRCNNLREKGYFRNDLKDSLWVYYFPQNADRRLVEVETDAGRSLEIQLADPQVSHFGNYKNDQPIGEWEYYDAPEQVIHRFNFDKNTLTYLRGGDVLNTEAGFIGGEASLMTHLYEAFDFGVFIHTVDRRINMPSSVFVYQITISESGAVEDVINLKATINNKKIHDHAVETINSMRRMWYPKKVNGIAEPSKKIITFSIDITDKNTSSTFGNWVSISKQFYYQFNIKVE